MASLRDAIQRWIMSYKQLILVRQDLKLSKGKLAAQSAHAAIGAFLKAQIKDPEACSQWLSDGQAKIALKVADEKELLEWFERLKKFFPCSLIRDAGRTQLEPGTLTCVGVGPAKEDELDKFTSSLKLL